MKKRLKICIIGKAEPIQGGVSRETMSIANALAASGHKVWLITNADQVESEFRMVLLKDDLKQRSKKFQTGGQLQIISSTGNPHTIHYIPTAKPFVTELAAMATNIVKENKCDLIYSAYFEPYAIAAYLTSQWTKVPFVVRHAGSDLWGLLLQESLHISYVEMLKAAHFVITEQALVPFFKKMGVKKNNLYFFNPARAAKISFGPLGKSLDINSFLKNAIQNNSWLHPSYQAFAEKKFDPVVPTFGIYGKLHEKKGSFDLLKALRILKDQGKKFQLVAAVGETNDIFESFISQVRAFGLEEHFWLLPFMSHAKIAEFIRACTVICYLERDFPVKIHNPTLAQEVFDCGKCILISNEIAKKFPKKGELKNKYNVLTVNPKNHENLASALNFILDNPSEVKTIGLRGLEVSKKISVSDEEYNSIISQQFLEMMQR